jgi:hypothetical protein
MEAQQQGLPNPHPERLLKNVEEFPEFERGDYPGHAAWNDWPWKIHRIQKTDQLTIELYHLVDDPMEVNDLAKKEPRRVKRMLKELQQWQASIYDSWEGKDYR